jgi:hypothetical protein
MKGNIFLLKTLSALPILTFIMLIAPLKASAADLPQHRIVPLVQSYGDSNKSCTSWTDGCVICKRDEKAAQSCPTLALHASLRASAVWIQQRRLRQNEPDLVAPENNNYYPYGVIFYLT